MVIKMNKKIYTEDQEKILVDLGERIKYLRIVYRITQDDLAEKADMSSRNISDIENAKVNCHLTTIQAIANAFDISISELFDFDKEIK